jgi:hypothetical protein
MIPLYSILPWRLMLQALVVYGAAQSGSELTLTGTFHGCPKRVPISTKMPGSSVLSVVSF